MTTNQNSIWVLTDRYGSQYGDHVFPTVSIISASQLNVALEELATQEPRLVMLESRDGFRVCLALGGPHAAMDVFGSEKGVTVSAITDAPQATEEMYFVGDWQPAPYSPHNLLAVSDVIAAAVELYQTRQLPQRVKWERW